MVIYTESRKATLAATISEQLLWKYVVPDGFTVKILEVGYVIVSDGKIDGYIDEVKIDNVQGGAHPTIADRAIINRELIAGQFWEYKATSITGGDFAVLLIYDKTKK